MFGELRDIRGFMARFIHLPVSALVTAAVTAAGPGGAAGGTIRHDRDDRDYLNLAAAYPQVGALISSDQAGATNLCGGTLIDPQWVLTAAHCVDGARASITFITGPDILLGQDQSVAADAWFPHPQWDRSKPQLGSDIGLVRLSRPITDAVPAKRYRGSAELGTQGTFVGYGSTGNGVTGFLPGTEGTRRAGHNMFDALGSEFGFADHFLVADFDDPQGLAPNPTGAATPLKLEFSIAGGDSGGGVFAPLGEAGAPVLVGVNAFIHALPLPAGDATDNASYGDLFGATRVSVFNAWIDSAIVPEPASLAAPALLAVLLLTRRRRVWNVSPPAG